MDNSFIKYKPCILCGSEGVNGSHVFSASLYPELKAMRWNILPMCPKCHTDGKDNFEKLSTPLRLARIAQYVSRRVAKDIYNNAMDSWIKRREDFMPFLKYLAEEKK